MCFVIHHVSLSCVCFPMNWLLHSHKFLVSINSSSKSQNPDGLISCARCIACNRDRLICLSYVLVKMFAVTFLFQLYFLLLDLILTLISYPSTFNIFVVVYGECWGDISARGARTGCWLINQWWPVPASQDARCRWTREFRFGDTLYFSYFVCYEM